MRRRALLLTLALAALALGPALYAAATPSRSAGPPTLTGTIARVDLAHHRFAVRVSRGPAPYRGRTVTVTVKGSAPGATTVVRLGHRGRLTGLKKNDRVAVTYRLDRLHHLVAIRIVDSGPATPTSPTSPSPTVTITYPSSGPPTMTTSAPGSPSASASADADTIHAAFPQFTPSSLTIPVHTTVTFVIDSGTHTMTSGANPPTNDNAFPERTASGTTVTFDTAGDYPFFCKFHYGSGMTGVIHVTP